MATQSQKKPTGSSKPGSRKEALEPKRVTKKLRNAERKGNFLKRMSTTQRSMVLGAVGAMALVGVLRIPVVRTMALPFLATAASKNWKTIISTLNRSR